jgi:hypothetical protein
VPFCSFPREHKHALHSFRDAAVAKKLWCANSAGDWFVELDFPIVDPLLRVTGEPAPLLPPSAIAASSGDMVDTSDGHNAESDSASPTSVEFDSIFMPAPLPTEESFVKPALAIAPSSSLLSPSSSRNSSVCLATLVAMSDLPPSVVDPLHLTNEVLASFSTEEALNAHLGPIVDSLIRYRRHQFELTVSFIEDSLKISRILEERLFSPDTPVSNPLMILVKDTSVLFERELAGASADLSDFLSRSSLV